MDDFLTPKSIVELGVLAVIAFTFICQSTADRNWIRRRLTAALDSIALSQSRQVTEMAKMSEILLLMQKDEADEN